MCMCKDRMERRGAALSSSSSSTAPATSANGGQEGGGGRRQEEEERDVKWMVDNQIIGYEWQLFSILNVIQYHYVNKRTYLSSYYLALSSTITCPFGWYLDGHHIVQNMSDRCTPYDKTTTFTRVKILSNHLYISVHRTDAQSLQAHRYSWNANNIPVIDHKFWSILMYTM